jgi:hypothetical protein
MSFWAAFGANLALNLLDKGKQGPKPIAPPKHFSTAGYRRGTGRRGSQATQSRAAQVEVGSDINQAGAIKSAVLKRMLRETSDTVKVAKATKA